MRSWGYKIILKYFAPISKNPIKYLSCAFALLGAFYTLVEIEQSIWSSEILLTFFRNNLAIIIFVIIFIEQNRCAMAVVSHVAMILFFKVEVPKSKCSYPFIVIESCYL